MRVLESAESAGSRGLAFIALAALLALPWASWAASAQGAGGSSVEVTVYVYSDGSARAAVAGPGAGGVFELEVRGSIAGDGRGCSIGLEASLYSQYLNLQPPAGLDFRANITQTGTVNFEGYFQLYANNGTVALTANGSVGFTFQDDGVGVSFDVLVNGGGWLTLDQLNRTLHSIYSGATMRSGGDPVEVSPGVYRVGGWLFYPNEEAGTLADLLRGARGLSLEAASLSLAIGSLGAVANLTASGTLDCSQPLSVDGAKLYIRPSSFSVEVNSTTTLVETPRLAAPSGDPADTLSAISEAVQSLLEDLDLEDSVEPSNITVNLMPGDNCTTVKPQRLPLTRLGSATVTVEPGCSGGGATTINTTTPTPEGSTETAPAGGAGGKATQSQSGEPSAAPSTTQAGQGGLSGKAAAAAVALLVVLVALAFALSRR